jgi:hypothetical protein
MCASRKAITINRLARGAAAVLVSSEPLGLWRFFYQSLQKGTTMKFLAPLLAAAAFTCAVAPAAFAEDAKPAASIDVSVSTGEIRKIARESRDHAEFTCPCHAAVTHC